MTEKNSIIKEAMLDAQNIQNALNANTKEILRGVAREEIDGLVKESLMKEIYEEEELDTQDDFGGGEDLGLEPAGNEFGGEDSVEGGLGDIDAPIGGEETGLEMGAGLEPELGMDPAGLGGDEMDMTAASDDEVIAIYKKLSGEDEIEIVGDEIHMNISEPGEYVVKLDDSTAPMDAGLDSFEEMGGEEDAEGDDVEYEIEMGDDEESDEPAMGGEEDSEEEAPEDLVPVGGGDEEEESDDSEEEEEVEDLTEAIPVGSAQAHRLPAKSLEGIPLGAGADNLKESVDKVSEVTKKYNALLAEARKIKAENEEFRTALKHFRTKLVETVLTNSKLMNATNLFADYSTTKAEKHEIIKRFNQVSSIAESKKLNRIIENELNSRKSIVESVETKIIKGATSSTSTQLNESTAYVDPSTKRIMDLINRVEKR